MNSKDQMRSELAGMSEDVMRKVLNHARLRV
jgi:hypothetical protein